MKIDLHCHTRKIKLGDSTGREVDKEHFLTKVKDANVELVAITNHNYFDYPQYLDFKSNDDVIIWPGIELDVVGNSSKGHCLIIVNPEDVDKFDKIARLNFNNQNADNFEISIEKLVDLIKPLDYIMVAHYGKKPFLNDEDINTLSSSITNDLGLFLEPSNLKSAGIMIAHNKRTLLGSDVSDWNKYEEYEFPELKIAIKDYNRFKLLLSKDKATIKTFVSEINHEEIEIQPFSDFKIKLNIYEDVNVFFGGKGTGKTEILRSMEKYFLEKNNNDVISYFAEDKSKKYSELTNVQVHDSDFNKLGIDDMKSEFNNIKKWADTTVTTTNKYYNWIYSELSHKSNKNFGFEKSSFSDVVPDENVYIEQLNILKDLQKNFDNIYKYDLESYLGDEKYIFDRLKHKIINITFNNYKNKFIERESIRLEKMTIEKMKSLFTAKQGKATKPMNTGFSEYVMKRIALKNSIENILLKLDTPAKNIDETIGYLLDKGKIYIRKELTINPNNLSSKSKFLKGSSMITKLQNIVIDMRLVVKNILSDKFLENLTKLKKSLIDNDINSLRDFLGCNFDVRKEDGAIYKPSSGEQSMLMLSNVLLDDSKNIYILDEPEMSVGHVFINDVILPRIKYLAKNNKKIIISTHDANLGVRSLPLQSIFRVDLGEGKYDTYIGNPFIDELKNITTGDKIIWSDVVLKTLEGGEDAFLERGLIYG